MLYLLCLAGAIVMTVCGVSGWYNLGATSLTFLGCFLEARVERGWLGIR